jgi:hypothetical protein
VFMIRVNSRLTIDLQAVMFFQTAVKLFQTLPTYTWLANAGITPDSSKTYTLSTITSALQAASGGVRTCYLFTTQQLKTS